MGEPHVPFLEGKTILVTGGTGSFGRKFTQILLQEHDPRSIRIFSRGELLQTEMRDQFGEDERLRFFIGDVRDRERVYRALHHVDVVVHAAALKHVPVCEYNPIEAVRTNIQGTINLIDAAIDNSVERVMAISTDKAVYPVNLYGATKMVMEKLMVQGNSYSGERKTRFSCVRYGNVVGSRGSVIPVFREQRKKGEITLTDERMTRFWISLDQGVRFVIRSLERMRGGEVFVPKIPSMRILDLAKEIAPGARITTIGIRPGEKIHEILLTEEEARRTREFADHFIIEPELAFWDRENLKGGTPLPDGFRYQSDTNRQWLTREEIRRIIDAP